MAPSFANASASPLSPDEGEGAGGEGQDRNDRSQTEKGNQGFQTPHRESPIANHASSIASIRLALTNLTPNREKQKQLLGHARTTDKTAFNYIRTVFGDDAVQLGADIAIPRRVRVLREWKNAIGWS